MFTAVKQRVEQIDNAQGQRVFDQVKSALNMAALKGKSIPKSYCAYVVPVSDLPRSLADDLAGSVEEITSTVAVVIGIQSRNDPTGEKGNELLQETLSQVRKSLLAYSPKAGYRGFKLAGGNLLNMADNGIWWLEKFSTTYYLESTYDN
ncbi:hypothetical protein A9Q74_06300 [Colwellia sp. 39_35_sub15_T18]|nr:hypothetical protein A9Q74_06300 [Colwellia sp. 39_35_sub15_T18]